MSSLFHGLKSQLTDEIFPVFGRTVFLQLPDEDFIEVDCIYDKNPEEYTPYETDVIEIIHRFKFRTTEVPEIPTGSLIEMDGQLFRVDRRDDNNRRLRGHSEGDGHMNIVFGGEHE